MTVQIATAIAFHQSDSQHAWHMDVIVDGVLCGQNGAADLILQARQRDRREEAGVRRRIVQQSDQQVNGARPALSGHRLIRKAVTKCPLPR